jgi:hypothetical protein
VLIPKDILSINPDMLSIAYNNSGSGSGVLSATIVLALDGEKLLQGVNLIDCLNQSVLPILTAPETILFDTQTP